MNAIRQPLIALYGEAIGQSAYERVRRLLERFPHVKGQEATPLRTASGVLRRGKGPHPDAILIAYSDQVREADRPPLRTLADFCDAHLNGVIGGIHLLPFYPSSSDDGFSVVDYRQVDPALGDWADVARIGRNFRLMFDAVINHVSAGSEWFKAFLQDDARYRDYFIAVADDPDLSQVVRPRALPLLTEVNTPSGKKKVWTTFSADQIDLNYKNPDVLLDIIGTLLFYVSHGAEMLRLDAIAYLWKEIGTSCIHRPQTHRVIQLLRAILDEVAPHVQLITETNVPHEDNVSYFGDGHNEAQLVYNFALPPLTLHTLHTGNARTLSDWAASLSPPSHDVAFFNFLASHDGIGLNPARGLLRDDEIAALVNRTLAHGGLVSYKHNVDGTSSPYELNVNYFDALSDPNGAEPMAQQIDRFVAAHAIMLSLAGVPAIYFHSLFGSRGWPEGARITGRPRTINRQKLDRAELERELSDRDSRRHQVFSRLTQLLTARSASPAFQPQGGQHVLQFQDSVFAVVRVSPTGRERVVCLHNVSAQMQSIDLNRLTAFDDAHDQQIDLIGGRSFDRRAMTLQPYQALWLTHEYDHE